MLDRCPRVRAAIETTGSVVVSMPTTSVTATVVTPRSVDADVAAAVVDPNKGPVLPAVAVKVESLGGLVVVAGGGVAAVVVGAGVAGAAGVAGVVAAVGVSGCPGPEARVAAGRVVETGGAVGVGVVGALAVAEGDASPCFTNVGDGVGPPPVGGVVGGAVATELLPVETGVVSPAWLPVVVDGAVEVLLDTVLALGSPTCEHTLLSRRPGGQHKSHYWGSHQ